MLVAYILAVRTLRMSDCWCSCAKRVCGRCATAAGLLGVEEWCLHELRPTLCSLLCFCCVGDHGAACCSSSCLHILGLLCRCGMAEEHSHLCFAIRKLACPSRQLCNTVARLQLRYESVSALHTNALRVVAARAALVDSQCCCRKVLKLLALSWTVLGTSLWCCAAF